MAHCKGSRRKKSCSCHKPKSKGMKKKRHSSSKPRKIKGGKLNWKKIGRFATRGINTAFNLKRKVQKKVIGDKLGVDVIP